jgi:Ca2+:H+ antiporter
VLHTVPYRILKSFQVLTGLTAEFLVDSISGLIETTTVTEEFVALILLPLVVRVVPIVILDDV